jgi:hypothetical protein
LNLLQVYTGRKSLNLYKIAPDNLRGATSPFLMSNQFGKLPITYSTLVHYFGNDLYKIQPALYYKEYNINNILHSNHLDLQQILTTLGQKIDHLYTNLYNLLRDNYDNNEEIRIIFHYEKALGLGQVTKISRSLPKATLDKFADLIEGDNNYLYFTIRKQGNEVVNDEEFREFVLSTVFYLTAFNAFAFIGDDSSDYKLFATQRKLHSNEYVRGLYSTNNAKYRLSDKGQQIYDQWQRHWNEDNGSPVWNLEDCWPIHLLGDARELITFLRNRYGTGIQPLEQNRP